MIDKLGRCPHCNRNWMGDNMLNAMLSLDIVNGREPLARKLASRFGYSDESQNRFSKVTILERRGRTYVVCPSVLCRHIFDLETGREFTSLINLDNNISIQDDKG